MNTVVLAGGVGGAKLADGFAQILSPEKLTVVVNTGDDFQHLGLTICPDLDTVMYTLAGEANPESGWGRLDESWRTIEEVGRLGGPDWFRLGDLDLATHLVRSERLQYGDTLTEATDFLRRQFGVEPTLLPMTNQEAPTLIETAEGLMPFQNWFVGAQWQPPVEAIRLPEDVRATPAVLKALEKAELVVIAPSNPFVSIDPILNVYPVRSMIADLPDIVVAVSPIVGGEALRGPAAKMMREMGRPATAQAIADYYEELIDLFVYDLRDEGTVSTDESAALCTDTIMNDQTTRADLAQTILNHIEELTNR
ncbi:MAG: 2-phospho-L-lactate transferase [Candidatus Promineifilaceae bacterium]|nr:2-phospho-L-lactate transferase [Candidatus Promineifilaceae bacterium]